MSNQPQTRSHSITLVRDSGKESPIIASIYKHTYGVYRDHGNELKMFMKDIRLLNETVTGESDRRIADGMGCLAAQLIKSLKKKPGEVYMIPTGMSQNEDFTYDVYTDKGHICVTSTNNASKQIKYILPDVHGVR